MQVADLRIDLLDVLEMRLSESLKHSLHSTKEEYKIVSVQTTM